MKTKNLRLTLPRRSKVCMRGGEALEPEMDYYTVLLVEEGEYQRQDFCGVCWEKSVKERYLKHESTFWCAKVPTKQENEKAKLTHDEKAIETFLDLIGNDTEEERPLGHILALYLERRKQIVLRKELKGQIFYEIVATEEMVSVKKANILSIRSEELQERLEALIG